MSESNAAISSSPATLSHPSATYRLSVRPRLGLQMRVAGGDE
jgi:hypothetical protein